MAERRETHARRRRTTCAAPWCSSRAATTRSSARCSRRRERREAAAGVVFFNDVGLPRHVRPRARSAWCARSSTSGRLAPGARARSTRPVGTVSAVLEPTAPSRSRTCRRTCHAPDVTVEVPGLGARARRRRLGRQLVLPHRASPRCRSSSRTSRGPHATRPRAIRDALTRRTASPARDGATIDHVELFGPPRAPRRRHAATSCSVPARAYDRSPCGTGTSAKMAVLHARGDARPRPALAAGEHHRLALHRLARERDGALVPHIRGRAFVTGRATLFFDPPIPSARAGTAP